MKKKKKSTKKRIRRKIAFYSKISKMHLRKKKFQMAVQKYQPHSNVSHGKSMTSFVEVGEKWGL